MSISYIPATCYETWFVFPAHTPHFLLLTSGEQTSRKKQSLCASNKKKRSMVKYIPNLFSFPEGLEKIELNSFSSSD